MPYCIKTLIQYGSNTEKSREGENVAWKFQSDRPIYTQLLEQIEIKIISGEYGAGEKMASVRDLALEAAVNPNTMQRALTELERLGLVFSQRTSGRTVTQDIELIAQKKEELAVNLIEEFLETMIKLGYSKKEIIELMESKI